MNDWWKAYNAYLRSEHWTTLREARLRVDGHRCTVCGSRERLQVHHLLYREPVWSARISDLRTLCFGCHALAHHRKLQAQGCLAVLFAMLFW